MKKMNDPKVTINLSGDLKLYGKTGTGCIDEGCMSNSGRQLGWFVGIVEKNKKSYAFALNYSDLKKTKGYAGPKAKKIVYRYFEKFNPRGAGKSIIKKDYLKLDLKSKNLLTHGGITYI